MMNIYSLCAILAGCFFGSTGLFSRSLSGLGLSTMGVLSLRCVVATVCFFLVGVRNVMQFKVQKKDLLLFVLLGVAGQGLFSLCYYSAINMMSISTACIILYLSPAIVTILARLIFKDKTTKRTVVAVVTCVVGCALVSGFGGSVSLLGVLCGLGSAVTFALINIWDRMLLQRGYSGTAVNFYLCAFAAVFGILLDVTVFRGYVRPVSVMFTSFTNFALAIGVGVVTGFAPYLCFSKALSGAPSGKVSILASTEPVTATLVSVLVYHEPFGALCIVGILLVLAGIVLQNTPGREKELKS